MLFATNTQGSGFLLNTQQHCFQGKGEREEPVQLRCLEKCCPSIQFSQQFCPRLKLTSLPTTGDVLWKRMMRGGRIHRLNVHMYLIVMIYCIYKVKSCCALIKLENILDTCLFKSRTYHKQLHMFWQKQLYY